MKLFRGKTPAKKVESVENAQSFEVDRGQVLRAILEDDDQTLFELLKPFGAEKEEILELKNKFLESIQEEQFADDLQTLKSAFKSLKAERITDIPNFEKFAALRAQGLKPIDAFIYANAEDFERSQKNGKRGYMRTGDLKGKGGGLIPIPQGELKMWRNAFPNDSDEELVQRYNKAIKA